MSRSVSDSAPDSHADSRRLRRAVRAFLVDPDDRVLLVRFAFPEADVWCAPGGGIDPGEGRLDGLRRELLEEVGLDLASLDVGPCVAHRVHLFPMSNGYDGQEEWFYFVRVPAFEPQGRFTREQLRAENLHEMRWWSVPDLHAAMSVVPDREPGSRAPRPAMTAPRNLPLVLERWLTDGVPTEMVELGV